MERLRRKTKKPVDADESVELTGFQAAHRRRRDYHAYQNNKKRRRQRALKIVTLSVAIILVAGAAVFWLGRDKNQGPTIHSETLEGIDIESIIEWNNTRIAVHYPRTKNASVNQVLADFAKQTVEDFKENVENYPNDHDELNMSFKTYRLNDDIVSFAFEGYVHHQAQAHGGNLLTTMTFDLKTGKKQELKDILKGDYLDELSKRAYEQLKTKPEFRDEARQRELRVGLAPETDNFQSFVLDADKIVLLFGQYDLGPRDIVNQRVNIPLKDIKAFLKEPFQLVDKAKSSPEPTPTTPPTTTPPDSTDVSQLAGRKLIALTFDDGPHPTHTSTLLDTLKREDAKATFFVLGTRVDYYGDTVRRAYAEGHQIASHTRNHKDLTKLSAANRQYEINSTIASIEKTIGVQPTAMRPPYGAVNEAVKADTGRPIVLWSVDPEDWKHRNADTVYSRVMSQARDGSIVLLHDIHATTVQAAAKIVPALKAQGYTLVTVDQLIKARGGDLSPGRVYYSMYP